MNYIFNYIDVLFKKYYVEYFDDMEKLVLGNLNVNIISKNSNNNILIIDYVLNYIWNIKLNKFSNIRVNNSYDKYLKDNLKFSNKKLDDKLNIFEYNINYVDINVKILFIDFRRFKFTEQKYYILFIDYFVNLSTINKFKYIFIINNFDYILNEYVKNIIVNIEKNGVQFIIFTSNNNIERNIKGLFINHTFVNKLRNVDILNDILDIKKLFILENKSRIEIKSTNFEKIINLFDNDLYKIILAYLLYYKFKLLDIDKCKKKYNMLEKCNMLENMLEINNFLYGNIFNYFISLKYVFNLIDNLIFNKLIITYINENKVVKKYLNILTDYYIKINNDIRIISYLLNSYFITIEEIIYIIRYVSLYKIYSINNIIELLNNNINFDYNNIIKYNMLIYNNNANINNNANVNKILKMILHNKEITLLNICEIKSYLMKFNIGLNIETKNKNINNKFNKLLFILHDNNLL
jgi:hypothetical protein